jgi:hypothetical protein
VSVKNRMDPAWDAAPAGGYRAVMVNLCLATAVTARLGVDGHVCELQVCTWLDVCVQQGHSVMNACICVHHV